LEPSSVQQRKQEFAHLKREAMKKSLKPKKNKRRLS
jgi:hypothetical protein